MSQITGDHFSDSAPAHRETAEREQSRLSPLRFTSWLAGSIPTAIVLLALAGIAYWGHHAGWRIPRFSQLVGSASEVEDWCQEHNVPETECVQCIPALLPADTDHGWCQAHGVHQCPHCHPEIAQLETTPEVSQLQNKYISLALSTKERQENNLGCDLYRSRVQFASIDAVNKAGIDVEPANTGSIVESISAHGEITYDETRVAHLASRAPGTIWRAYKQVGDRVRRGDVLALIDSSTVGNAKAELLDAIAQVDYHTQTVARLAPLHRKNVVTDSEILEAETELQQATIQLRRAEQTLINLGLSVRMDEIARLSEAKRAEQLRLLGIPATERAELKTTTTTNNLIPVVATLDGVVIAREAVRGEVVTTSQLLFELADIESMWLRLSVALEDAEHLQLGQSVRFRPDGSRQEVRGKLTWISTDVDKLTRTVEVRSDIPNPAAKLRNETFGTGQIVLRQAAEAVVVPSEAVQWDGSCYVVFVRDKNYFAEDHPKLFHTRSVRPGVTRDGTTEIIAGLLPGEVVATKGSSVLRSQILKNNLGAGCTCGQ